MRPLTELSRNQIVLFAYYALFALLALATVISPHWSWDIIAYVGSVRAFETSDVREIHRFAYENVKKVAPAEEFEAMAPSQGLDYRSKIALDPVSFAEQLPFYRPRVVHTGMAFLLYKAGLDPVSPFWVISSVSIASALIVLFFIARLTIAPAYRYALPPLAFAMGVWRIGKAATPDGLAFLGFVAGIFFLVKRNWGLLVLLPLLIAIRTDTVLFVLPCLLVCLLTGRYRLVPILLSGAAALFLYAGLNRFYHHPGWQTTFDLALVSRFSDIPSSTPAITARDYLEAVAYGLWGAVGSQAFWLYAVTAVCAGIYLCKDILTGRTALEKWPYTAEMGNLLVLSVVYSVLHFALFPVVWERFFIGPYVMALVVMLSVLPRPPFHTEQRAETT